MGGRFDPREPIFSRAKGEEKGTFNIFDPTPPLSSPLFKSNESLGRKKAKIFSPVFHPYQIYLVDSRLVFFANSSIPPPLPYPSFLSFSPKAEIGYYYCEQIVFLLLAYKDRLGRTSRHATTPTSPLHFPFSLLHSSPFSFSPMNRERNESPLLWEEAKNPASQVSSLIPPKNKKCMQSPNLSLGTPLILFLFPKTIPKYMRSLRFSRFVSLLSFHMLSRATQTKTKYPGGRERQTSHLRGAHNVLLQNKITRVGRCRNKRREAKTGLAENRL